MLAMLGYVAQLVPPLQTLHRDEERLLASLLRLPFRTLPWPAYFNLHDVGGVQLSSAEALVRAAAFRYAWGSKDRVEEAVGLMSR